jgi:hypothetical protein
VIAAELSIIASLDPAFRSQVKALVAYCEVLTDQHHYRLSVTSYSRPEVAGRRTEAQQRCMFDTGKSKADGVRKRSAHQDGLAIHFGFRDRRNPSLYWSADKMGDGMLSLWALVVDKAKRLGWTWGGDFMPIDPTTRMGWDPEHFEMGAPAGIRPIVGGDQLYKDPA